MARWVGFILRHRRPLVVSRRLCAGFFGVTIPVLRVAGGIIVAAAGWRMLNAPDARRTTAQRNAEHPLHVGAAQPAGVLPAYAAPDHGPRTISVAVSLGAGRPTGLHVSTLAFFIETVAAAALLSLTIYGLYRYSARRQIRGPTGTTIVVRLSTFLCSASAFKSCGTAPGTGVPCCSTARRLTHRCRETNP